MPAAVISKGASVMVAPFAFWILAATTTLLASPSRMVMAAACPAAAAGERVRVEYVYDGDTIKLDDGRRLRFIGINTPELNDKHTRLLANAARSALQHLLDSGDQTLLLQHGQQRQDHYGRILAHPFLENGVNVAASLLQQGFATVLVVPPNTWGAHCYQRIENEARIDRKGLWGHSDYQPQAADKLPLSTRGFRIVQGRVNGIRDSRYTLWIDIDGPLVLQISKQDLGNFDSLESLIGKQIEARGWIRQVQDDLRMKVRHSAALVAITMAQKNND
jgi:micrococcal nuclease